MASLTRPALRLPSRSVGAAAGVATVLLLACVGVVLAGRTPAPLVVLTVLLLAAALSRPFGWALGLAFSSLALVALLMVLGQIYPDVDAPFGGANLAVLVSVSAGALVRLILSGGPRPVTRQSALVAAGAGIVPAFAATSLALIRGTAEQPKLAWMMGNDSVWNVMFSRIILLDGGSDPDKHPSPAVGASEIIATFLAPGRGAIPADELLQHDLLRAMQALVLTLVAASVFGGLAFALAVPARHPVARFLAGMVGAVLPWTWFVMGHGLRLGFWNAVMGLAVLAAAWLVFAEARRHPTAASAAQMLAGVALMPIWAPLMLVPLAFFGLIVLRHWREHLALWGRPPWRLALWLVPPLVFSWYFLFVIRPLLAVQGGHLAADGWMFPIGRPQVMLVLLATVGAGLAAWASRGRGWELLGSVAVSVVGLVGLAYLMAQREGAETGTWGYYPAKFGWLVCAIAVLIATRAVLVALLPDVGTDDRRSRFRAVGAVGAAGIVLAVLLGQVPPADLRPQSEAYAAPVPAPDWRLRSMVPLVSIAREDGMSEFDSAVPVLLEHSSPATKQVLARYHDDVFLDSFVNSWLLQQPGVKDLYEVRNFAYFLDSTAPQSVCDLVQTWGKGVRVTTTAPRFESRMAKRCPGLAFEVEVEND